MIIIMNCTDMKGKVTSERSQRLKPIERLSVFRGDVYGGVKYIIDL